MKNKKGFTLVELLVVIAIIGLLSTIAVVSLTSARGKARDAKRVADMRQLQTALEQFYNDNNGYPAVGVVGTYPSLAAANDVVLGGTNSRQLTSNNAAAAGSATGAIGTGASATTVYMGLIPAYPTPGRSAAVADCSAYGAAYCYTSNAAWASATSYASAYTIFWQLESVNSALGTTYNCQTSNAGTVCSS
jgi:prepilin-type N-terminal cleavage/methylation domain-containing protein